MSPEMEREGPSPLLTEIVSGVKGLDLYRRPIPNAVGIASFFVRFRSALMDSRPEGQCHLNRWSRT